MRSPDLPAPGAQAAGDAHLLTVAVEDYFQVGAFNRLIQRGEWYRFEPRLERNTARTLELLAATGQRATFFVLGWIAEKMPELVRLIADRGHEVASKGYYHRAIRGMTPAEFREDLARARSAIEAASGRPVRGYRVADRWFGREDLWALDVLAEEGYAYDSSIGPIGRRFTEEPWRRFAHRHLVGDRVLWEFPISSANLLGWLVPVAGGNWLRQLPGWFTHRALARWERVAPTPLVMYFHIWELDPELPKISAAPWLQRVRTYRNLERMPGILDRHLRHRRYVSIAEHLGLEAPAPAPAVPREPSREALTARTGPRPPRVAEGGVPVTVVIPCYNEALVLPYLANTLRSVMAAGSGYAYQFLFVDDRSVDDTWEVLHHHFGDWPNCRFVQHEVNQGIAGAIATGLREAGTEIVASIDCDCSYDPHLLPAMIPLLGDTADLVTASPYHPDGGVRNVPEWRLMLSRTLSRLYRLVLHHRLSTYTSCFRIYRRSRLAGVPLQDTRFLGVAELLGRVDLAGGRIVEFPATLQVRVLGASKMKILRTIMGHLGLLGRLALLRLRGGGTLPGPGAPTPRDGHDAPLAHA
jgi:polysaccharide deacetylase family protein (PEP-CTERM system associated)